VPSRGPQARLKDAAEGMTTLGRAITALPEVLRNAEQIAAMLSGGACAAAQAEKAMLDDLVRPAICHVGGTQLIPRDPTSCRTARSTASPAAGGVS